MLADLVIEHDVPGLVGGAIRGDQLIALGGVGRRKVLSPEAVTAHDRFHLGSCTKAMTATLFALSPDSGLTWDTTLAEAFPDLATMHADYASVTLEQLLTHWGGTWSSAADHTTVWNTLVANQGSITDLRAWFVEQVLSEAPEVPPGTEHMYSNSGYMIVGAALERALGQSWEQLIDQRLFTPLAMDSCGFGPPGSEDTVEEPWGHVDQTMRTALFVDNPPALGPAGRVHCAMADWGKFIAAHLLGARGEETILPAATFERMHTPWPGGTYAHGWLRVSRSWGGGDVLTHSGSTLWFAVVWIAPEVNMAFFSATNIAGEGGMLATDAAVSQMIAAYLP